MIDFLEEDMMSVNDPIRTTYDAVIDNLTTRGAIWGLAIIDQHAHSAMRQSNIEHPNIGKYPTQDGAIKSRLKDIGNYLTRDEMISFIAFLMSTKYHKEVELAIRGLSHEVAKELMNALSESISV